MFQIPWDQEKFSFPDATFDLDLTQTAQEYIMAQ